MGKSSKFLAAMDAYDADDAALSRHLMEECALSGEPDACFLMALWCSEAMPPDQVNAHLWLSMFVELAENGNLDAAWNLGQSHRFGDLVQQDIALANYWLERAAKGGHAEAQHHLAWFYETGQYDYPLNQSLAEDWYRKAFEQGHPETLYEFAMRQYEDGKPNQTGLELLIAAANKGFKQAEHVLRALSPGWDNKKT